MAWIKRNLFFVIGGIIAIAMMAGAGFYLFENAKLREEKKDKLTAEYEELGRLTSMRPGPGDGKKTDNTKAAQEFKEQMENYISRATNAFFVDIPPIPASAGDANAISDHDFASALRDTIGDLTSLAASSSVLLPPAYDFSFRSIKSQITFAPGSLQSLSVQLGEVKVISEILFQAKINSLDGIRRERVSPQDREMADYIEAASVTNELAVLTPYEVTFQCFSGELAAVLAGFASSPYAIIVKRVAVEPASAASAASSERGMPGQMPGYQPPGQPNYLRGGESEDLRSRYGVGGGRGGSSTVLNEQPLRVLLRLELVKGLKANP